MDNEVQPRYINPDLIDQAETVRTEKGNKNEKFARALSMTRTALHIDTDFTEAEINKITENRAQATVLAAGARLIGELEKWFMKHSLFPHQMKDQAAGWLREAGQFYGNKNFRNAVSEIKLDHHDRPYDFDREFARDIADYLAALSLFFTGTDKADNLIVAADQVWKLLIESLEDEDADKSFFIIEKNWFLFKTGRRDLIDIGDVAEAFKKYYYFPKALNADRLKTLAVRTSIMVGQTNPMEIKAFMNDVLKKLKISPFSRGKEVLALQGESFRNLMFKVYSAFRGKLSQTDLLLYADAWHLGDYQQQRFKDARK